MMFTSALLGNAHSAASDNSVDEMQTDVMRFLAIIGFCLVAIFAVVRDATEQAQAAHVQTQTSSTTMDTVDKNIAHLSIPDMATLSKPKEQFELSSQVVSEAQMQIKPTPLKVVEYAQAEQTTQVRAGVGSEAVKSNATGDLQDVASKQTEATHSPSKSESSQGLSLEFENDKAFLTLMSAKAVDLYAVDGQQTWQLNVSRGTTSLSSGIAVAVNKAKKPTRFYEMHSSTVPADFEKWLRTVTASSATWAVVLPENTESQLQRYLQQDVTGVLIINGDGNVSLRTTSQLSTGID